MFGKAIRTTVGLLVVAGSLYAAAWAVRDCPTGPYLADNCLWLSVRDRLHLPPSKLWRSLVLELVGLALATTIFLAVRYLVLAKSKRPGSDL